MPGKLSWLKNTYFWIAAILLVLGIVGLTGGDNIIRDPGQRHESKLWAIYLAAAAVMLINGLISHRQWLSQFEGLESK